MPYRQHQVDFIAAINDARVENSTDAVETLMKECKVEGAEYEALKTRVLHLMPRHCDILKHNREWLKQLCGANQPRVYMAVDTVALDPDHDATVTKPNLKDVTELTEGAALADCVAPRQVEHCLNARVMAASNCLKDLGFCHASAGYVSFDEDVVP